MPRALWVLLGALILTGHLAGCGDKPAEGDAPAAETAEKAADEAAEKAEAPAPARPAAPKLDFPGTADGAKALLAKFVAEGADTAALTTGLRPTSADYAAVFVGDAAKKAEAAYGPAWEAGQLVVRPKAGQTEVLLSQATTDQLKAGDEAAKAFPGGYAKVVDQLKPGLTLYRFKFVEPGKELGMAFDGLVYVNGRWAIFPKPWRALR